MFHQKKYSASSSFIPGRDDRKPARVRRQSKYLSQIDQTLSDRLGKYSRVVRCCCTTFITAGDENVPSLGGIASRASAQARFTHSLRERSTTSSSVRISQALRSRVAIFCPKSNSPHARMRLFSLFAS